jgi:uncharacterized protein (TIGR02996 family)
MLAEENAFIEAIRSSPHDDDTRLVYADWLEERADPRAEYLRLDVALANIGYSVLPSVREEEANQQKRLEELSHTLAPEWRVAMSRPARVRVSTARRPRPQRVGQPATPAPSAERSPSEPAIDLSAGRWRDRRVPRLPSERPFLSWPSAIVLGILFALGMIAGYYRWRSWWRGEGPSPITFPTSP